VSFDIPPQPLPAALRAFAEQSGLQLAYTTASMEGVMSDGLRGNFTPEQGLVRLLAGTGVSYQFTGATTVTLTRAGTQQEDATVRLGPIAVEADTLENPTGPVDGYRATRSATATKTGTPIMEIPAAVQVVPADLIEDQQVQTFNDVLRNVAGAAGTDNDFNVGSQSVSNIRGFNVRDIFKDGVRLSDSGQQIFTNIERVEVLKGPSSLLYGQLEPGGLVNIVTKRPLPNPRYEAELGVGSFDTLSAVIDTTGPLGTERALFRFIGSVDSTDTYVDNGDDDRYLLAPSLTLFPTENLKIDASFEWTKIDVRPIFSTPILDGRPDPRFDLDTDYQADFAFKKTEETFASVKFDYTPSVTTRANLNVAWKRRLLDESTLRFFFNDNPSADVRSRFYSFRDLENEQISVEGNVIHEFSIGITQHTLLFGADYRRYEDDDSSFNFTGGFPAPVAGPGDSDVPEPPLGELEPFELELDEWGVYLQDEAWVIEDTLKLVGTLRYTAADSSDNFGGGVEDDAITPRLGTLYQFTPDTSVYASYATSFQPVGGTDRSGQSFEPSEGEQFEIGLKHELFGGDAAATLSVYQITQTNVLTPDPVDPDFSIQTGEVRSRGVEFDLSGQLAERFNIYASASYIDSEITETNVAGEEGNRNPELPEFKGSLWLTYDVLNQRNNILTVGGGVFRESSRFVDTANEVKLPDFVTVDLGAWYDFSLAGLDATAQLNVRNLFDEEYFVGGFTEGAQRGQPRTVDLSLSVRF
jgi:iron complex outermembrane receptor protein